MAVEIGDARFATLGKPRANSPTPGEAVSGVGELRRRIGCQDHQPRRRWADK